MDIRVATLEELRILIGWAIEEGWNPGPSDAVAFHAADPEGFLLGWLDGEPVGGISFVRYDPAWAFLGLYIVRPEFRGRGHGMELWRAAMARREGRSVGLDGVVARQGDYARSGFQLIRRNVRYSGIAPPFGQPDGDGGAIDLVPGGSVPFGAIARLDRGWFPADRAAFLRGWLGAPGHVSLVSTGADGTPIGYGLIRPARLGWKVAPLFAPDEATAERLLLALVAHAPEGDPVYLDVPEPNVAAVRLAERHGMRPVFETARMVAGPPPVERIDGIFGITSFELG